MSTWMHKQDGATPGARHRGSIRSGLDPSLPLSLKVKALLMKLGSSSKSWAV